MRFETLAARGAQGVAGGAMAAWLGFAWLIRPVPTGGMNGTSWAASVIAALVVCGLLSAAHLWFGAQLLRGSEPIR